VQIRFHVKWVSALIGVVLLAAVLGYGALYAPGSRPTCISFEVAGDKVKLGDVLSQFSSSKRMIEKRRHGDSLRAYSDEFFLKWDQTSDGSSFVVLCANTREGDVWRQAVKDLERGLLEKVDIRRASLQRGGDYSCDRSCEFRNCANPCSQTLQVPIDFDRLRSSGALR
jgi:hypothetical protein